MIAAVCELSGAVTLGAGVSDTIIRQISKIDSASCWDCGGAHSKMPVFMLGEVHLSWLVCISRRGRYPRSSTASCVEADAGQQCCRYDLCPCVRSDFHATGNVASDAGLHHSHDRRGSAGHDTGRDRSNLRTLGLPWPADNCGVLVLEPACCRHSVQPVPAGLKATRVPGEIGQTPVHAVHHPSVQMQHGQS